MAIVCELTLPWKAEIKYKYSPIEDIAENRFSDYSTAKKQQLFTDAVFPT